VPFEQYKTQVLLLHSQQTTLDRLRTGFNDRYSVHCATSGTEALNTLGDTPIHVIVSAQDLPGMSGLDALREAKKRSPETIAILLAGTDAGDGLEALVSDKEVFQIVRGEISPDALKDLIDNATKSVRLLALAEASNDTAANVDEPYPTGEHIVMETAANGSVIISDGTGTVPVLRPEKIQVSANSGGQTVDVLVLTKDEEFLATIKESSRGMHNVHHAVTPVQSEEIVRNHSVGVLVTDAAMVGSNIEALSQRLRVNSPRLVAIVAGRRDDGELLMDLINRGHVYRFLLKPVSPGRARLAIEASVKHHMEAADSAFKGQPRATPMPAAKAPAAPPVKPAAPAAPAATAKRTPAKKPPQPAPRAAAPAPRRARRPVAKPAAKPPARPAAKSAPAPQPAKAPAQPPARAAARPQPAPAAKKTEPRITSTPAPVAEAAGGRKAPQFAAPQSPARNDSAPIPDRLDDAFEDTNSFTETMTGIAVSVGKSLSGVAETLKNKSKSKSEDKVEPAPVIKPAAAQPARGGDGGLLGNPKVIALIAGVVLFSVLSLWMFSGDEGDVPVTEPVATATESPEPGAAEPEPADVRAPAQAEPDNSADIQNLLQQALDAKARGDVYSPARQNAVEFLLAARNAAPDNSEVTAQLETTVNEVFGLAENALLANRSTDASRALRVISLADPENPRLAFLNAQLSQQQLRSFLDDARAAIRENRFEDAGRLLAQAEDTVGGSNAEIDAISTELANARSSQRLDDVLSLAGQRLSADQLVAPPNDNARYYFQLAQNSEPGNAVAQQGLVAVASKLALRARAAIDAGNYAAAEGLLNDARALDPNSSELKASADALANARNQQTVQDRVAAEQQREAERLAAEREAVAAREAEADRRATEREAAEREAARLAAERSAAAEAAAAEAAAAAAAAPAVAAATAEPAQNPGNVVQTVAISALERIGYVPPRYPRAAQRRNASGYVDLAFTVMPDGKVADVEVTESKPGTLFDDAAVEAVEQWVFAPPMENGTAVQKRVAVRMSFALQ
jgi:TonB family protein